MWAPVPDRIYQNSIPGRPHVEGDHFVPGHHTGPDGLVGHAEHVQDHVRLFGVQQAGFFRVLDQQPQFLHRMDLPFLGVGAIPEPAEEEGAGAVHEPDQRCKPGDPGEQVDGPGDPEADPLRILKRGDFRHLLAEHHV